MIKDASHMGCGPRTENGPADSTLIRIGTRGLFSSLSAICTYLSADWNATRRQ
jgi:hypothetical protein